MGFLTTHVLDMTHGSPAGGLHIELFRLSVKGRDLVTDAVTNDDGRCDNNM